MWKIGDKIKFVGDGELDSTEAHGFILGKTYEIIDREEVEYDEDGNTLNIDDDYLHDGDYKYWVIKDGESWIIEPNSFEKYKKKVPKNDIDILDNIQDNFRFGI